jgi:hypothetical protein
MSSPSMFTTSKFPRDTTLTHFPRMDLKNSRTTLTFVHRRVSEILQSVTRQESRAASANFDDRDRHFLLL